MQSKAGQHIYTAIGCMSGTSLDGLDLAYCSFRIEGGKWTYEILDAKTYPYSKDWFEKLQGAAQMKTTELPELDREFGRYLAARILEFCEMSGASPDFISSHGHTVKHDPANGVTIQIGNGQVIHEETGLPVVFDFRAPDVALGGQGAPLVPIGDQLLFPEYRYVLNLGGIANISIKSGAKIAAFDITACNLVFNHFARQLGQPYDRDGNFTASGKVNAALLQAWNSLSYFSQTPPKSLDASFVQNEILPLAGRFGVSPKDAMRTWAEHLAIQLNTIITHRGEKILVTGGGAYHIFFMQLAQQKFGLSLIKPESLLVDYKEALIFAFMGLLRIRNEVNCLSSVTGASTDHSSGRTIGFSTL